MSTPTALSVRTRTHRRKTILQSIFKHFFLIVCSVAFLIPFIWMISTSLKPDSEILVWPPQWIPHPFQWSNYPQALTFVPFFRYFLNTLLYGVSTVVGTALSCTIVAYGFARIEWPERNFLFALMLATMMLPYQALMIPLFLLFRALGWTGTFLPLIVPSFFGNAFFIFLLRQFFKTIPQALVDAARIDGCSEFRIFAQIILPLAKPAIATVALFQFINAWNDFLGPIIYLNSQSMYTISLGLQDFLGSYGSQWGYLMAASVTATLPIIILFFFTQKTFIQGITLTGIK